MNFKNINIVYQGELYRNLDYNNFLLKYKEKCAQCKRVLVLMTRTPNLLFAIMMLLEMNITYVITDPDSPKDYVDFIIRNSGIDGVITDSDVEYKTSDTIGILTDKDCAYVLYTSGTTGHPKGVEISRASLMNFICGITEIIDFSPGKKIACFTAASFDMFFIESIMAIYLGLTVFFSNKTEQVNPKLLTSLIIENSIEMLQITPSRFQMLLNYDKNLKFLDSVTEIMIGGEPFHDSFLTLLQTKDLKIYNLYGPTETTIFSSIADLTFSSVVNVGKPIKNTEIYILDEYYNVLEKGKQGQIAIAGDGLAIGYCNDENLTNEKFITIKGYYNVIAYLTGDLGRYSQDGFLEVLGRQDNQIKLRGYRVEVEGIENFILQYEGIDYVIVNAVGPNNVLCAVYSGKCQVNEKELIRFLKDKLPDYMIPVRYCYIEKFLFTTNGKINRKSIIEKYMSDETDTFVETNEIYCPITKKVINILYRELQISNKKIISLKEPLSFIGTDSVSFIKLVLAIESTFSFEFDDDMLILDAFSDIKSLIEYVKKEVNLLD